MKRIVIVFLLTALLFTATSCQNNNQNTSSSSSSPGQSQPESSLPTATPSAKIGLYLWTENNNFTAADEDGDGTASLTLMAAAVVLDADGRLKSCRFDEAEAFASFDTTGAVTSPPPQEITTKQQQGDDYGMREVSPIQKEWYEQAEYLAGHLKGMTLEEIRGIQVDEKGYPADEELLAGCTVKISGYLEGIIGAIKAAEEFDGQESDPLFLGVSVKKKAADDASEDSDGKVSVALTATAVTQKDDGKITGCKVDSIEGKFSITSQGEPIPSEGDTRSKKQLGDDYGMRSASGIGKEWHEQAKGFEEYVLNKNAFEVATIAVDENSYPTDGDLSAVCTISIGDFQSALEKAIGSGKSEEQS